MSNVITITTDFGDQFASSQLRAVIASLGFTGHVIENHSVTPFSIAEGAFEIQQISRFSPDGSVHVGVIDPGVGSERWGIVVQTKRAWYVGPNNGLFYPAANHDGVFNVWKIHEEAFGPDVATTFHGRDVFIKSGVYVAQGKKPEEFGCEPVDIHKLEKIDFQDGQIIHIDAYGNYKIYWPHQLHIGKQLIINTKNKKTFTAPAVKTFTDIAPNNPLALIGSHGTLELAVNVSNAKKYFGFELGEVLQIEQM